MDWANERYVRLFVRDTTTWKLLPWQSRALLPLIMRKLDRSGVLDLGEDGEDGLAAVVEVPLEFLKAGLPDLLKRKVCRMGGGKFVMPNFLAAQEAKQSDAQRKRESREYQRLVAIGSQAVTDCHNLSESQPVTACPPASVLVTPDQTRTSPDPDLTQESLSARDPSAGCTEHVAQEKKLPSAHDWLTVFSAKYWPIRARPYGVGESDAKACGRFGEYLDSLPDSQRAEDWEARDRIIMEFLTTRDKATVSAGWPFSFFVTAFRGLAIPHELRPKPDQPRPGARKDGKPGMQARY